jgi:hypothetical protein
MRQQVIFSELAFLIPACSRRTECPTILRCSSRRRKMRFAILVKGKLLERDPLCEHGKN